LNGMTGATSTVYSAGSTTDILDMAIHPDGTIFATTQAPGGPNNSSLTSLVGIDSAAGGQVQPAGGYECDGCGIPGAADDRRGRVRVLAVCDADPLWWRLANEPFVLAAGE
jgi:hypothetical protein